MAMRYVVNEQTMHSDRFWYDRSPNSTANTIETQVDTKDHAGSHNRSVSGRHSR